jgi:hypothetical protein
MFLYSGRDIGNHILGDLWRYDIANARWTQLQPVAMNGWNEIVEWGLTPVMTPRGMIVVTENCPGSTASCRRLVLQDPFTEQWAAIENVTASQKHAAVAFISPRQLRDAQAPWFAEYSVSGRLPFVRLLSLIDATFFAFGMHCLEYRVCGTSNSTGCCGSAEDLG